MAGLAGIAPGSHRDTLAVPPGCGCGGSLQWFAATLPPPLHSPSPSLQFSLSLVVKESFKLYKAASEGVINLADAFFEMEYYDASE
jgi:hypothetical protein